MAYSNFKLDQIIKEFNLTVVESSNLFRGNSPVEPSASLVDLLQENIDVALAINTEKARSEMIIAPVFWEIRRRLIPNVSLFSGLEFTVDESRGLNGICDFILSQNPEQLFIRAPVVTAVEAKNENLKSGFAQCVAEMIAAQIFNEQEHNNIPAIYGVVTIGTIWRFLRLRETTIEIDLSE
jgi:hypothetical protein